MSCFESFGVDAGVSDELVGLTCAEPAGIGETGVGCVELVMSEEHRAKHRTKTKGPSAKNLAISKGSNASSKTPYVVFLCV